MQSNHGDSTQLSRATHDALAVFANQAPVSNQVGGDQTVHGAIYNAPVTIVQSVADTAREASSSAVEDPAIHDDDILELLAFSQMLDRRANIDPPHAHTCQWILSLKEFRTWISQPRGLLWIKGNPGVGKSVLMAYLYEELRRSRSPDGVYLDFFLNARGDELQKTPVGMLRSLLNQLFNQDPQARSPLRMSYREKHNAFGRRIDHSWDIKRQELESLLIQSVLLSAKQRQVTIFIDALDEAGEQSAYEIAHYLHVLNDRIVTASSKARICISSRHHPVPSAIPGVEIVVESHNRNDIATFVHSRLDLQHRTLEDTPDLDRWYELKEDLVRRANGIFQWVRLVVPILEQYLNHGDSLEDAQDFIDKVPESLEEAYSHILCNVIHPRHRNQSYMLFQWVCLAQRPLSVTELRYALAAKYARPAPSQIPCSQTAQFLKTNESMRLRLRALSGGLIVAIDGSQIQSTRTHNELLRFDMSDHADQANTVDHGDPSIVQPIHQSVSDFLITKGLALLASLSEQSPAKTPVSDSHHSPVEKGHAMIYLSCLNYLCSEDPEDVPFTQDAVDEMLNIPSQDHMGTQADAFSDVQTLLPFSRYAITWLPTHALAARDARDERPDVQANLIRLAADGWMSYTVQQNFSPSRLESRITTLHIAAFADLSDLMDHFLKHENDLEAWTRYGYTALHIAADRGHETVAKQLVRAGADLHAETSTTSESYSSGLTPLALAAANGHLSLARWLLDRSKLASKQRSSAALHVLPDAVVDDTARSICIALYVAAEHGHLEVVKMLIGAGAKLDMKFGQFGTPLQAAARFGHGNIVKLLIEAHADVNALGGRYGSALMAACRVGDIGVVRSLLNAGARVNLVTEGKKAFALQQACEKGHFKIVALLLTRGANVNLEGGTYGYALHAAAYFNHNSIIKLLLRAGAKVNAVGGRYGTALLAACSFNHSMNTAKLLLNAGADINAAGNTPYTPLQLAAWRAGSADLVRFLIKAKADVNAPSSQCTALQAATVVSCDIFHRRGNSEVVTMLLDAGADINALGGEFGTPLQIATEADDQPMIDFLVSRGAREINVEDYVFEFFSSLEKWNLQT